MSGKAPRAQSRKKGETGRVGTARRELVESELYEHATRLFAERGFAGTSLQDIAESLGISRPALYYYVKSKEELLARLVTEVTNGPLDDLQQLVATEGLDPVAKVRGIVEVVVRHRASQPERFRLLMRSEADLSDELTEAYDHSRRAILKIIATAIDDGVRAGVFRPVDSRIAALGVLGMGNWVSWWFQPGGRDSVDDVVEQLGDMAIGGLQRDEHRALADGTPAAALKMLRQDLDHLERIIGS
ncbi:MAG TPA: TetR/AcrR family transcriptional regulator [Amycolatopsis sp.]|uniref:TetR/AcrR family transcriptional regulator n=1 Tax=Amycolatopsis nalaikhensis TaxID=715472 RepID=A0ABY8XJF4_9PSEU|nr:TetR/AcrR family transcriptional regulator [Amycolatopsis sp. 2-2]WIV55773.1 TetR/AcrR family transcriptional regulator [Amycolatopsis sp. 2-2]